MGRSSYRRASRHQQQRRRRPLPGEISFKQLVLITREQWRVGPVVDDLAWKERVEQRAEQLGFRSPKAGAIYAAQDAVKFVDRAQVQRPAPHQGPTGFTSVGSLCPTPPENACGSSKKVSGRPPLKCTRPAGHDGDHGLHSNGLLIVRWSR